MTQTITSDEYRAMVNASMTERAFQAQVVALAQARGWLVWHDNATNHRATCPQCGAAVSRARNRKGLPDLVLIRERVVWCELKSGRGAVSADQRAFLDALRAAGCEAYVWRPSDMDAVQGVLG